jgi:hypothetical protein
VSGDSTDVAAVKRALADLADAGSIEWSRAVVAEATDSLRRVEHAAAFADAGGPSRLALAIEQASRAGERDLARRGQRALAAFERFRRAAESDDHFRRGHGMDLMEETKRADR